MKNATISCFLEAFSSTILINNALYENITNKETFIDIKESSLIMKVLSMKLFTAICLLNFEKNSKVLVINEVFVKESFVSSINKKFFEFSI